MQVILELQELVKQKERFMSSVSHELRTPLNGIIGLSESLLASAAHELSESSLRAVTAVKSSGLKLLTLINNVLDANLMRLGRLVIKDEPVNMADVARDVMQVCQPLVSVVLTLVACQASWGLRSLLGRKQGSFGVAIRLFLHLSASDRTLRVLVLPC